MEIYDDWKCSFILFFGTRWKWVVSFTSWLLYVKKKDSVIPGGWEGLSPLPANSHTPLIQPLSKLL